MIDKLQVSNFKCLNDKEINFKKLTILAGSNSSGKSSVIQTLLLSRITIEKLIQYSLLDADQKTNRGIQIPLNGRYCLSLGNTKEVLTHDVESNIITIQLFDHESSLFLPLRVEDTRPDFYNLELQDTWSQVGQFGSLKNEFYYLSAERIGPRLVYDVDQQEYVHVGWQGEYTIQTIAQNKENEIQNSEVRRFLESTDFKLITQVRKWMEYIFPGFYLDEAILDGKLKKAHTTFSKSSPTNIGFGISYALPIVVNGLLANINSIFIVENPEAHLHPKGQSNLGYFLGQLASSGLQVIIETHSEHIINGIRRASLSLNNLKPNDVIINFFSGINDNKLAVIQEIKVSSSGDLTSFPKDFFDQVQQDMYEIFRSQNRTKNG